jgi:hypothetical protein
MASIEIPQDSVLALFKVGDKIISPTKHRNYSMFDGMLVELYDPQEQGGRCFLSDWMQVVYACVLLPRSAKTSLRPLCSNLGGRVNQAPEDMTTFRQRKGAVLLSELETLVGVRGIESRWRQKNLSVPVIDGRALDIGTIVKDSGKTAFPDRPPDLNAVSTGTYSIGPSGKDYLTIAAAFTDIANLTGNLTFDVQGVTTETAGAVITENLDGNAFRLRCSTAHNGNPNGGILTSLNYDANALSLQMEGPGTVEIDGLNVARVVAANSGFGEIITTAILAACTVNIHDLLWNGNDVPAGFYYHNDKDATVNLWNCKAWDFTQTGSVYLVHIAAAPTSASIIENSTFRQSTGNKGIVNANSVSTITYRNNVLIPSGTGSGIINHASATGRNNAGTGTTVTNANWGTGTGNIPSITAANELESLTDTDDDYLDCKVDATGQLDTGGVAPGIAANTLGTRGNKRPGSDGFTSIGADEFGSLSRIAVLGNHDLIPGIKLY